MKSSWKVFVGFIVLAIAIGAAVSYLQAHNDREQRNISVVNLKKFTSELSCVKPVSRVEEIICANDTLKQLEQTLTIAYHNNSLWRLHQAIGKHDDELCSNNCLINLDAVQQRWLVNIRNQCDNISCLTKAYTDRITELNGQQEPLPSFRLALNKAPAMCSDMLEILNNTPRDQLGACARYDLSDSGFTEVSAELGPEHWQTVEHFYYEKSRKGPQPFTELWPAIEQQYQAGARKLYGVKLAADERGDMTWLFEARLPSASCQTLPYGVLTERVNQRLQRHEQFKTLDVAGVLRHTQQYGWSSIVAAPKTGLSGSLYSGQLLRYNQEWFVLSQERMAQINGPEETIAKSLITLEKLNSDVNEMSITKHGLICGFWYNY